MSVALAHRSVCTNKCHCAETLDPWINVKTKHFHVVFFWDFWVHVFVCFWTNSWCVEPYTVEFFSKQVANNFLILVVDLFVLVWSPWIGSSIKKVFWLPQIFYFRLSYFQLRNMFARHVTRFDSVLSNWPRPCVR